MQRRVRPRPPHDARFARRAVEQLHAGRRRGPFPKRINRAPPPPLVAIGLVAEFAVVGNGLPQPRRLEGFHGRPADFFDQQPRHRERLIADHFSREPEARAAREEPVLGIALQERGRAHRGLPVGRARDDQAEQLLHIPAALDESHGEPVEQVGMRRHFALRAEIARRRDQSLAETLEPSPVHLDARGQGMARRSEPPREPEPVARRVRPQRREK